MKRYKLTKYEYPDDRPLYGKHNGLCVTTPILFGKYYRTLENGMKSIKMKWLPLFGVYPSTSKMMPTEVYRIRYRLYYWRFPRR